MTGQLPLPLKDDYYTVVKKTTDWDGCKTWIGYVMLGDSIVEMTPWMYLDKKDAQRDVKEVLKRIKEEPDA